MLVLILLVAFGLRVWGLADHNIWWDEGIGVWLSRMPLWESIRWTATDTHPPLYYMLLHSWRAVAGEGEFSLRFLSVICSLLTVPLIYRLGKMLGGFRVGALAALLLALSRFAIWWGQEIRQYVLAALLATGSLWAAVWIWKATTQLPEKPYRSSRISKPWVLYVVCTLGSLYTLYLTATVPVVTNLGFLAYWMRQRRAKRRVARATTVWITAQITVVALFLPWAVYALPQMPSMSSDAPFTPGFFVQLYSTLLAVGNPVNLEANAVLTIGAFIGLALGLIVLGKRLVQIPPSAGTLAGSAERADASSSQTWASPEIDTAVGRRRPAPFRWGGLVMLVMGLLLPALVVVAVSLPGLSSYFSRPLTPRYLLPLSACYSTLLAWGISELKYGDAPRPGLRRWLALAAAGMALVAALSGLRAYYPGRVRHDDYATIAEVLKAHRRVDEAVVLYVDRDWPVFTAHYGGTRNDLPYGATLSDPAVTDSLLLPIWDATAGIWLVSTPESLQADPAQAVPQWLAAHSVLTRTMVSGTVSLTYYTRTPDRAAIQEMTVPGYAPQDWVTTSYGLVGTSVAQQRYGTGDTVHLGLYWIPPLPDEAKVLLIHGTSVVSTTIPPVTATTNIVRNQVDIPLTPDLAGGSYALYVAVPGYDPVSAGDFTLVRKTADAGTTQATISTPVDYRLGETIRLIGYDLPETEAKPGETLALTLYWQAETTPGARYKVFTHLLGETYNAGTGNFLWGQQDSEPAGGQAPTTTWAPETVIADSYLIQVNATAPPGDYTIEVGMYGLVDGVRLAVAGGGDAVRLATVEVREATNDD